MAKTTKTTKSPKTVKAAPRTRKKPDPVKIQEEISRRAHEICMERGDGPGDALSDWLQAEREIKKKHKLK
ncbi:MAG: DUF2934 domain-containing protein [Acidobacteriota bacterium]|nr:DUF2934 domain-containing protein [Acidobacteriota bacterium]